MQQEESVDVLDIKMYDNNVCVYLYCDKNLA